MSDLPEITKRRPGRPKKKRDVAEESSFNFTPPVIDTPLIEYISERTEDQGVSMEDLDTLQTELETLLSRVAVSGRSMKEKARFLGGVKKVKKVHPPKSQRKLKRGQKRIQAEAVDTNSVSEDSRASETPVLDAPERDTPMAEPIKNDILSKFWTTVDQYCSEITPDDIMFLDALIKEHEQSEQFLTIPPLGKHFTLRWQPEDTKDIQQASTSQGDLCSTAKKEVETPHYEVSPDAFVPLCENLKFALKEENITVPNSEIHDNELFSLSPIVLLEDRIKLETQGLVKEMKGAKGQDSKKIAKEGAVKFETQGLCKEMKSAKEQDPKKLAKEGAVKLETQGLGKETRSAKEQDSKKIAEEGAEKQNVEDGEDEILAEMKRVQSELKVLSQHNLDQLRRLKVMATEEMRRQTLKKELDSVDRQIVEVHKRIQASKLKRIPANVGDRELAWHLLHCRNSLLKQIDFD